MAVFYAPLLVPGISPEVINCLLGIERHSTRLGYHRLECDGNITDQARNLICLAFLEHSRSPDDTLVMLDTDHLYDASIVEKLAAHRRPVVGALYFGRREPYLPMFFVRRDGQLAHLDKWPRPGAACAVVGTAAIAIKHSVFEALQDAGFEYPWFRYEYVDKSRHRPSEDMYFGKCCEQVGIPHYVDTTLSIPHLHSVGATEDDYRRCTAKAER